RRSGFVWTPGRSMGGRSARLRAGLAARVAPCAGNTVAPEGTPARRNTVSGRTERTPAPRRVEPLRALAPAGRAPTTTPASARRPDTFVSVPPSAGDPTPGGDAAGDGAGAGAGVGAGAGAGVAFPDGGAEDSGGGGAAGAGVGAGVGFGAAGGETGAERGG